MWTALSLLNPLFLAQILAAPLSLTQDFSNTFTLNFLTLFSHSKTTSTKRIFNYEIWNWKFELVKLDCSVSEWVEQPGGEVFIRGRAPGQPAKWWGRPAPHHGQMASPFSWWSLASWLKKISTPLVLHSVEIWPEWLVERWWRRKWWLSGDRSDG